ncbi:transglutaminase domain-containing protein [Archangium sp.]|uniref:transglutaminase domain-containing protein n=1 Tax=Archangium sp. TaxID=1872627 RepID=UPI002D530E99|nr:transglutaminase domain-containing protein [Archangium sp.]HYO59114.1 transglutaminase domain-containing protein [Archangium sp.]
MLALFPLLLLALPAGGASSAPPSEESARFVFAWRGVPVGTVTLSLAPGVRRFTYTSRHLHTRGGHVGERVREVSLEVGPGGTVVGRPSVPQALWLWKGPLAPGCVTGREELSGREGPHCVTALRGDTVEGTMLGQRFTARYDERGRMAVLEVGEARFTGVPPGVRLRPPPELFAEGVPVEGAAGPLAFSPPWPLVARPGWLTDWRAGEARVLAEAVHAAFPEKGPGAADWSGEGEGEAGGCLAHALRFAARAVARGQRVALVHGLLVVDGGPARPHAWVRVGLAGGGTLDLDPTSLDAVTPETHLPLAVAEPGGPSVEAGERWLALLRGEHRVVRRPSRRE